MHGRLSRLRTHRGELVTTEKATQNMTVIWDIILAATILGGSISASRIVKTLHMWRSSGVAYATRVAAPELPHRILAV